MSASPVEPLAAGPTFSAIDHEHMGHALRLAARGLCTTQPNPRVGCIIADGATVLGEGFHERAGEPHAEVFALQEAGPRARGATAYVTLEPCAHHGRTPPCSDALIAAGIARVVVAAEDPNPKVDGRGVVLLRQAGVQVECGLMREAAEALNAGFVSRMCRDRPFVRVKLAMSLDGRTALGNGDSTWITGEAARADVQHWRARSSAILTGSGTALADNPRLTVRLDTPFQPPLRVLLDRQLQLPAAFHLLDGSVPTLVLHAENVIPPGHFAAAECLPMTTLDGSLDLQSVLALLAARGCNEVQVEAGPTLCGALFNAGLVDELLLYIAPVLLGDQAQPLLKLPALHDMADRWQMQCTEQRQLGNDLRLRLTPATHRFS